MSRRDGLSDNASPRTHGHATLVVALIFVLVRGYNAVALGTLGARVGAGQKKQPLKQQHAIESPNPKPHILVP